MRAACFLMLALCVVGCSVTKPDSNEDFYGSWEVRYEVLRGTLGERGTFTVFFNENEDAKVLIDDMVRRIDPPQLRDPYVRFSFSPNINTGGSGQYNFEGARSGRTITGTIKLGDPLHPVGTGTWSARKVWPIMG